LDYNTIWSNNKLYPIEIVKRKGLNQNGEKKQQNSNNGYNK
jgi:hypothetical protein